MLTHVPPDYHIVAINTKAEAKRKRGHVYKGRCCKCGKHVYDDDGDESPKPHHYQCPSNILDTRHTDA
jgi:hypothetical protein